MREDTVRQSEVLNAVADPQARKIYGKGVSDVYLDENASDRATLWLLAGVQLDLLHYALSHLFRFERRRGYPMPVHII